MNEIQGPGDRIGIALSGGGSRAIAFHLGCLKALETLGILASARVLSCASGGCVIGAMYASHEGDFAAFERRVRAVLREGFLVPALRTSFTTMEGLKAVLCFATATAACLYAVPLTILMRLAAFVGGSRGAFERIALPRRFASRTTILRRTFDDLLFHGRTLGSLADKRPRLVAIATELRTGSAFYFMPHDAGCWRFGHLAPDRIPLAQAVAASAAYPLFLPALDERYAFSKADRSLQKHRVTLTDGGIYDNMALAPLWPDRDPDVSVGVEDVDTIIACRAGYGGRTAAPSLFLKARMTAAFFAVHARAQNAAQTRLFDLKAAGRITSFALPFLDQDDRKLKFPPPDLVPRSEVADYPTDFSAMDPEWIERLSKRGEQLTLAVIREHAPHLMDLAPKPTLGHAARTEDTNRRQDVA